MSYDIYGNPLQRGHCEVHPHVHEEYPCSVCLSEKRQQDRQQQQYCDGNPAHCESAHYLGQAREHIDAQAAEIARLREALAVAHDHIDMSRLEISHCKDAALIRSALGAQK